MTKYQDRILKDLKLGAKLKSTEGKNYKTWLVYPNKTTRKIRRDSAEIVCELNRSVLRFGKPEGISHI
jgi:hypothetical protein